MSSAALHLEDWPAGAREALPADAQPAAASLARLQLQVRSMTWEAEAIMSFDLRDPFGAELPPFEAGAHIDVHVDADCVRQYSLCNDPAERHRYVIAPQREEHGRGGSRALHDRTRVGDLLTIGLPRNNFPLSGEARRHLLLAGGIGVTPMMAMVARLEREQADYRMYYCTRSARKTAFLDRLSPLVAAGKVVLHHDEGDAARALDLRALLAQPQPGTHLYHCGPPPFMQAAAAAASHWPAGSVHFEYFTPPAESRPAGNDEAFTVRLVRSGLELAVPPDKTIVQVLREHGVFIETSCESGLCGTCLTRYLEGEPEHRDQVLDDADRREYVLVCCARSKTPVLTLDL